MIVEIKKNEIKTYEVIMIFKGFIKITRKKGCD
jgi:F0F1-type ATP synthase epsilon subunit